MPRTRRLLRALVPVALAVGVLAAATTAQAQPSAADIQQQIEESSAALEKIVEQYNKVNEQLKIGRQQSAALAAKIGPLRTQYDDAQAAVARLAVDAYKTGSLSAANALLGAASDGTLTDRLGMLDQVSKVRRNQVADFSSTRQRFERQKSELDAVIAKEAAQAADLASRRKQIEADLAKLFELRRQAYGAATRKTAKYTGTVPSVSGKAGVAVKFAYNAIGTPYAWAGEGSGGYDCSGLTLAAWRAAGVSLPHNAAMQWDKVAHISRSSLAPGDLVFYRSLGHVALYVGSNKVIHAPHAGEDVQLASVDVMSPYGYGRVRT